MIEKMTHVAIMSSASQKDALLQWLAKERGFHVMPIEESENEAWKQTFAPLADETQKFESKLNRLNSVVTFCQEFASKKPSFIDAMLPLKTVGTQQEISSAVSKCNIDELHDHAAALRSAIEASNEKISRLQSTKAAVQQFAFLGDDLPKLQSLQNTVVEVVSVPPQGGKTFLLDERIARGAVAAEELFASQAGTWFALAAPAASSADVKALIDEHALHQVALPKVEHGVSQELMLLDNNLLEEQEKLQTAQKNAAEFADLWLRDASLAAGSFESDKNCAAARNNMFESGYVFVTRGYLKSESLFDFKHRIEASMPGATIMSCAAPEGEEPPVSLKWNKWISPASLLVKMYGLPTYSSLDPTPYLAVLFFCFVGMCLGDAVYGAGLILAMLWLKKKYADQTHLQGFFQCFVYCGITSIIVGILTGSFMGDLFSKIPALQGLYELQNTFKMLDPIQDSQTALYIAIGIGIFTQFYGMALCIYRDLKRGDKMGAVANGLLWMGFLGFVLLAALTGVTAFWYLWLACIVGLVLTQGRDQKNWISRILVGVISLYGIVGAYGASQILSDLISYARLMALGLTSAALGSTFNLLAQLAVDIPLVGVIVAVVVVVIGHLGNLFLGLLGGFVHSARLIMLEFFSRFYEAGGQPFKPYGFESTTVGVKEE